MSELCPTCGELTNSSSARLIKDTCGHKKCRVCLLYEESGCKTCEEEAKKLSLSSIDSDLFDQVDIDANESGCLPSLSLLDISNPNLSDIIDSEHGDEKFQINDTDFTESPATESNTSAVKTIATKNFAVQCDTPKPKRLVDRSHIITLPGIPEKFKCTACGKTFKNKKGKCYHDGCVTGILPYHCSICNRSFVKKSHFEYHERVHNDYKPFKCEICGKAFAQKNKLNRHMGVHSEERPFLCPNCGNRYKKKDDLRSHMTIHSGLMPHVCESCGKKFRMRTNLNRHMQSHSNERPHACDACGKSFKDKTLLVRHKRTHAKERPYSCEHCSRVFVSKSELGRHLATHTDGKPFSCTICKTQFRRKDNLSRHVRHHHSAEQEAARLALAKAKTMKNDNEKLRRSKRNTNRNKTKSALKKSNLSIDTILDPNSPDQMNSPLFSQSNTTPVIRAPGELSNAVPVINGPISSIMARDQKSKLLTYTEPIPAETAVVINQRIEETLYPHTSQGIPRCYREHSSRIDGTIPFSNVQSLIRAVPIYPISTERRMSDSSFCPPKGGTLTELKSSTMSSDVDRIREKGVQTDEKTKEKCTIVMDKRVNICFKNNEFNHELKVERTNCVSTIKKI